MMNFQVNKKVSGVVKWFLPFYLFTFLPLSATAQKLAVSKPVLECGRTGFKQPVTATFELKNKGHRRLLIESVKPDCGCTDVEFPKEVVNSVVSTRWPPSRATVPISPSISR